MPETAQLAREPVPAPGTVPGEHLTREVGIMAGRLARLVEQLPAGLHGHQRDFLWGLYRAVAGDRPPSSWSGGARERLAARPDPLGRLADALGLSPVEADLLVLAGLADEHEGMAAVLRLLHPNGEPRPTVGLAARLLCEQPGERPLLRAALLGGPAAVSGALLVDPGGPFFERSLRLAEGLWAVLQGHDVWPAALRRRTEPVALAGLEAWLDAPATRRARAALASRLPSTVLVTADDEEAALARGGALVAAAGVAAVRAAPAEPTGELARLLGVHALARGAVPVAAVPAAEEPAARHADGFHDHPGPVVLCARTGEVAVRGPRPLLHVPTERLAPADRRRMWAATLPGPPQLAALLAARHAVEPAAAAEVAADVRGIELLDGRRAGLEDVSASVRSRAGLALPAGVGLLRPAASWAQLVLFPAQLAQLREAVDRLVHQATVLDDWGFLRDRPGAHGVRMLLAGPPGTGKTLASEVLAGELGVELLTVDISRVVSKWIGETEKNLAAVFDAAERAQAALLFDEADALFGKRTEVTDAHDRYANLETAYLLARLERFEGLAILATNLRQNIDPAFTRRLEFVVDFDEPGPVEREALWRCHLPARAPLAGDVDLAELAALYAVVGAVIRNAAVAAGFLAAADGGPITRAHLVHALRREYDKTGRSFPGVPAPTATRL
jgi:ATPase family associated with various cellular activities (AAA)